MTDNLKEYVSKLLSVPFKHRGRGYDGADCYGLVILFYRDFLKIQLDDVLEEYTEDWSFKGGKNYFLENYHTKFQQVMTPATYDIVLFQTKKGIANHAGIVLTGGKFIHCSRSIGTSINRYAEPAFQKRLNGFYHYIGVR